MDHMGNQKKAYLFAGAAVLLWSTVASAFKLALRDLEPLSLLLYASLTSTLFMGLVLLVQGKLGQAFSCTSREYRDSLMLGVLNPFLYYAVLFQAYDLLPAQVAQPLNYTWALTLALLSVPLLKQKLSGRQIVAGLICYAGVWVIASQGDLLSLRFVNPLGVALALGSTVIWALYWLINARDSRDPVLCLFLSFVFALPLVCISCWLFAELSLPSGRGLLGAIYVGLVEMGLAFILWLKALRHAINTAQIANLIFLSPFISLFFISYLVGEPILMTTVIGLMMITSGLLLQQLKSGKNPADAKIQM